MTFEDDEESLCFVYNTNKDTAKCDMFIKEVDRFAQHALETYRGHVQFWKEDATGENSDHTDNNGKVLLCELPVLLPKVFNRAHIHTIIKQIYKCTTSYCDLFE